MNARVSQELLRHRRAIREKRGQGRGESYEPFIKIGRHEFASHGLSVYYPSNFQSRSYHLLSNLEVAVVMYLELLQPSDVREQYPLRHIGVEDEYNDGASEAEGTLNIARSLGIRHPSFSATELKTMTTDLVATLPGAQCLPVHVKYEADLADRRNKELFKIEQLYWKQRGAELIVATERSVSSTVINNLAMVRSYQDENAYLISEDWLRTVICNARYLPMGEVLRAMAVKEETPEPVMVDRLKASISRGRVRVDLSASPLRWGAVWPDMTLIPSDARRG